jgi:hypothetical protein
VITTPWIVPVLYMGLSIVLIAASFYAGWVYGSTESRDDGWGGWDDFDFDFPPNGGEEVEPEREWASANKG